MTGVQTCALPICPAKVMNFMALLTGIVLIVYSLNGFVGYLAAAKLMKSAKAGPELVDVK